jgi:hypothetical protein
MDAPITISCSDCTLEHTQACADCLFTFLVEREPDDAIVIDAAELRAVRLLARGGLVPDLRHAGHAS